MRRLAPLGLLLLAAATASDLEALTAKVLRDGDLSPATLRALASLKEAAAAAGPPARAAPAHTGDEKRDILFVVADDLRPSFGAYGAAR